MDKQRLYRLYVEESMTLREIAELEGVSHTTIYKQIKRHNIRRRPPHRRARSERPNPLFTKDKLCELYNDKGLTLREIARQYDISFMEVQYWLDEYNIPRRDAGVARQFVPTKSELIELYEKQGMTLEDIAQQYGVSTATVADRMRQFEIEMPIGRKTDLTIGKDQLITMYWLKGMTQSAIGQAYGVSGQTVRRRMKKLSIPTRRKAKVPREELQSKLLDGMSVDDLSEHFGVPSYVITYYMGQL